MLQTAQQVGMFIKDFKEIIHFMLVQMLQFSLVIIEQNLMNLFAISVILIAQDAQIILFPVVSLA